VNAESLSLLPGRAFLATAGKRTLTAILRGIAAIPCGSTAILRGIGIVGDGVNDVGDGSGTTLIWLAQAGTEP